MATETYPGLGAGTLSSETESISVNGILNVNETWTYTATYTTTLADVYDASTLINTISVDTEEAGPVEDIETTPVLLGTVSGHLYTDTNGNGIQDASEPDLANVDILVTDVNGVIQIVETDSNGDWIATVPEGTTTLDVDANDSDYPTGYTQTEGDDPTVVTAVAGIDTDGGIDGYYLPGDISGHLYTDTNGNGVQDVGEPDLVDVDVVITDVNGVMQTVTTDSSGDWVATVPPGTTTADIDETDPDYPTGSVQTEGTDPTVVTAVAGEETVTDNDGFYTSGTVSGHLYTDTNGNGIQEIGEPDLSDVDIVVTDVNGDQQTVTTNANGDWTATVPPGATTADIDETDSAYPTGSIQTEGTDPTMVTAVANMDTPTDNDGFYIGNPTCTASNNGPICDGADVTLSDTGGDATSWLWSSDGSATFNDATAQSPVASNVVDGEVFTVVITDTDGFMSTCSTTVTVHVPLTFNFILLTDPDDCTSNNGSIVVLTSGGSGTIMYSINGDTPQVSPLFSGLTEGSYLIEVTNGDGSCPIMETVQLNDPAGPTIDNIVSVDEGLCESNTGSITIQASGGSGPLEYSFDNGVSWDTESMMSDLIPGSYFISVRNGNNTCSVPFQEVIIAEGNCDCDDIVSSGVEICDYISDNPGSSLESLDCDGDGETNDVECANGDDPTDPCSNSYTTGAEICAAIAGGATGFDLVDCDGGGVTDAQECIDGTDPTDPCDDMGLTGDDICASIDMLGTDSPYWGSDCDGGGVPNEIECANGGDPLVPSDDCDSAGDPNYDLCQYVTDNPTSVLALADCDGGGVPNGIECANGGDPLDPADDCDSADDPNYDLCQYVTDNPTSVLALADCDGGGVPNGIECVNGGDPLDPTDDCDSADDPDFDLCQYVTDNPTSVLALADCDGGGVPNGIECSNGGDPLDPADDCDSADDPDYDLCAYVLANPTSILAISDCDNGGITNITECLSGGDPLDPSDDTNPNPDENVTYVEVEVSGDVSTNDMNFPDGSTYEDGIPDPNNPDNSMPVIEDDGTYTFTSPVPGVFTFQVPVTTPDGTETLVDLVITVLDSDIGNNVPVANVDIATTPYETPVTLVTLVNDYPGNPGTPLDASSVNVTEDPTNGTTMVDPTAGDITYTPNDGFIGLDTLTYEVFDIDGNVSTAQQIITVLGQDSQNTTTAAEDNATTPYETPVSGNVSTNDTDAEGDNQIVIPQVITVPEGMLTLYPNGDYEFTPTDGFVGPVDFPYEVFDTGGATAMATLHILVQPQPVATITGLSWKDANGNGIQDFGEDPIEGIVVILEDCDGNFIDLTMTNADGEYTFVDVLPGMVRVRFDNSGLPPGCAFTYQDQGNDDTVDSDVNQFGNAPCITILGGEDDIIIDAGLLILGNIGDFVWHDLDGDGIQESGEPGIEGVTVNIYNDDADLILTTTTDASGFFLFENIYPDEYFVEFIDPDGYTLTSADQGGNDNLDSDVTNAVIIQDGGSTTGLFTISSGENQLSIDAGYYICVPIGETVWYDVDTDNVEDPTENGINGMEVTLYRLVNGEWEEWDSMFTGHKPGTPSDDGYYNFCAPPGTYYIHVQLPPIGLVQAQPNVGSDLTDSDVTNAFGIGTTNSFTVVSGEVNNTIGAGYYPMAEVGNYVWDDSNYNGIQDGGELPIEGVMVQAFDLDDNMVSEAMTDNSGEYNMDYLQQESYYLKFTPPVGYGVTVANAGDDETDSDVTHAFGANTTKAYALNSGEVVTHVDAGMALGVLPVEWLYVKAANRGDHNLVEWATATEINSDYFEVERRVGNDPSFRSIAKVESAGNSLEVREYDYEDGDISQSGVYYYRIKQVDVDGRVDYSDIVSVTIDEVATTMSLYPNPAINTTMIKVTGAEAQYATVSIFTKDGKLIRSGLALDEVSSGNYELTIDVATFLPGVYTVQIETTQDTWTEKLIVVR